MNSLIERVNIVIAEDDAVTRLDLRRTLEALGHQVLGEAQDGRQAVALARTLRPDLIILDVRMPQMDGLEAARIARREGLGPVMLLTAYAEDDMLAQADAAGVVAYLKKPFRPDDLPAAIAIALGRHRERATLEAEIESLRGTLEARKTIGRAKAVLQERYNLTEREAFQRIHAQSVQLQKPAHEIAQAILIASEMGV